MNTSGNLPLSLQNKFTHLGNLIGNTPMIGIQYGYRGKKGIIYAKCESYNFTGSIKDRMALYMLKKAYVSRSIRPGNTIVEATSGNSGISFAAIGKALGHPVKIIMPDWLSVERKLIIQTHGAEIISISKEQGGFTGSIRLAGDMAAEDPDIFLPCQFSNRWNVEAHKQTTGMEIYTQLQKAGLLPDAFIAGVGTGGTVMGTGAFFKEKNSHIKVHPLEPMESPTMSTGYKTGNHRIQGISDEFIPDIVQLDQLDAIIQVSDGDAILMAQKLAARLGLSAGISSGANLLGAIKLQEQYGMDSVVVTTFADCNKKYLSTGLMKEEPVMPHHLSPHVTLLDFITLPRAW